MYLVIYSMFSAIAVSSKKRMSLFAIIITAMFLLWFMGGRNNVGCDYLGYLSRFNNASLDMSLMDYLQGAEPGFEILNDSVKRFDLDYMWLNVISSAMILWGYFRFFRISSQPWMALALFFPILIVQLGMSGLRQGIALAFFLCALVAFSRRRGGETAAWILLAGQFHTSALVFLPLAALAGRSVSFFKLLVGAMVFVPAVTLLIGDRLEVYQDRYIDQIYGEVNSDGAVVR